MKQRNHRIVTIVTSLCLLVVVVTLGVMTAPNGQAIAALQGSSATPFLTPALKGTIVPVDDPQSNAGFGSAVSTSNGVILVGAPHSYANQGTAYIFDQPNFTTWDQAIELVAPDGDPGDLFGSAVSIGIGSSGMVAVVGAPGDDSAGIDAGAVYVYVFDGQIGWTLTARINAPDASAGDQFGNSIGYSNGNIIVGAPFADAGGYTDIGAAYVFVGNGANWSLDQKLDYTLMYPPGVVLRADNQHFGYAVDIFGNEAVVSSVPASDTNNRIHILNRVLAKWYFQEAIQPPTDAIGFGRAVSIYHDTVAVGAPLYDDPIFGVNSGRIFVYRWNTGGGTFALQPDGDYTHFGAGHQGGSSVDVYRVDVAAGAPYATVAPGGGAKGSVLVFDPNGWLIRNPDIGDGAQFGASVAFWGVDLVIGAPGDDHSGLTNPGAVYIYRVVLPPWGTQTVTPTNYPATSTFRVPSLTPSSTPTDGPAPSATPARTPTSTPPTTTAPFNATPAPHFFAMRHPTLTWNRISWALAYQIEIDDDPNFGSPVPVPLEFSASTLSYTVSSALANGIYYWHVHARKNATEWSEWSKPETIIVSAP